ncbi:9958_t:CDS:2, partial [Racocetra fulgida]
INILLPKKAIIDDFLEDILRKLSLPEPTNRIRLFEITNCKILKEYNKLNSPIDKISENATLYAELRLQARLGMDENDFAE